MAEPNIVLKTNTCPFWTFLDTCWRN